MGKYWRLGPRIGGGSFGVIYRGEHIGSGEEVAIKLEPMKARHPQLIYEAKLYTLLKGIVGIPAVKWYGQEGEFNVMVADLLGPSLEDLFNYCGRKFSLKTVLMIADQLITRLQYVHSKHFLHRDVKPDNFLAGIGPRSNILYIIDFGLAKKYWDGSKQRHIPYKDKKSLTGTARYASISTHIGIEQARRDDLESLGYVLVYFLRGSLPWQGIRNDNKRKKYEAIMQKKRSVSLEDLCAGYPVEFLKYIKYCRSLRFEEKPDYGFLKSLFKSLFVKKNYKYDYMYDWSVLNMQERKARMRAERPRRAASPNSGGINFSGRDAGRVRRPSDQSSQGALNGGDEEGEAKAREDAVADADAPEYLLAESNLEV